MKRIVFLDYLRVAACMMVMLVHACEPFYLGGEGTYIANAGDAFWVTAIDSALRPCIGLFVITSSYLLFPLEGRTKDFFKRRFVRVCIPFAIWSLAYALVPLYGNLYAFYADGAQVENLKHLALNFVGVAGHLWFVYMLLGIYLMMPLLSPWAKQVSKRGEEWFLGLWLFTTLVPFLRQLALAVYGLPQVWGEANWNEFGTMYGVSGFIGFLVLGHYFRTYVGEMSWKKTLALALPLWGVGYGIATSWFWNHIPQSYPVDSAIDLAVKMEVSWGFTSTGVVLMTIGYFLVARKLTADGWFYRRVIVPISKASYGMYLMHIFYLAFFSTVLREMMTCTPLTIVAIAGASFVCSFATSAALRSIPKAGKYLS